MHLLADFDYHDSCLQGDSYLSMYLSTQADFEESIEGGDTGEESTPQGKRMGRGNNSRSKAADKPVAKKKAKIAKPLVIPPQTQAAKQVLDTFAQGVLHAAWVCRCLPENFVDKLLSAFQLL